MSRAFVKESDSEVDELPDLPISSHPNRMTPAGLAQLRARLAATEAGLAQTDGEAVGGRLEKAHLARELRWLQARIASAIVVDLPATAKTRVGFGARVAFADENGQHYHYRIVGEDEADPEHGLISWVSPLARALEGAEVGDRVIWKRPIGDHEVEILSITYGD